MAANYPTLPTIKYIWTSVDQQVAIGQAPSWYTSRKVTPYLVDVANVQGAIGLQPGMTIDVDLGYSHRLYSSFFIPRGYRWVQIPSGVTGSTIQELCAALLASDPSGALFPPLYYDLAQKNKTWPGGVPIWRLLVDYWGNGEYRAAQVEAKGKAMWVTLSPNIETELAGKRISWVLAREPIRSVISAIPSGTVTQSAQPKLTLPRMKVGLNHSWAFDKYGLYIGPHDEDWIDRWLDQFPEMLRVAKHRWGIEHVRMFILCNGFNYGKAMHINPLGGECVIFRSNLLYKFDPPPQLHQKFLDDFERLLKIFKGCGCKLIPSLLDFGAFSPTPAGGKRDLAVDAAKRRIFMDTVLEKFLDVSTSYRDQIYAWEVMNEPSWTTRAFSKPIAVDKPGILVYAPDFPILEDQQLADFLNEALSRIEARGFSSTVGHRTYSDMQAYPTGKRRQFHFYAWPIVDSPGFGGAELPRYTGSGDIDSQTNTFVGEIGSGDHGCAWPQLAGADATGTRNCVFERLKFVARQGYPLALLWGDSAWRNPGDASKVKDTWEFSNDAILGLTDFTFGLFPDGIP